MHQRIKKHVSFFRIVSGLTIGGILVACIFVFNWFFAIKTVTVTGVDTMSGTDFFKGRNILFLNINNAENSLYLSNRNLRKVTLSLEYPSTIHIIAEEATPLALLKIVDGFFLLSTEGKIIAKYRTDPTLQVPVINYFVKYYFYQYHTGDRIEDDELITALILADKLPYLNISLQSIDIINTNMIVLNTDGMIISASSEEDAEIQYQRLRLIMERVQPKGRKIEKIDVRFEKPIITYTQ